MDQMKIGLFLKELRNERGLTQEQLAEKLNVSNRSVSRWETASTFGIFTEILIVIGIIISITLAKFVADNTVQLIVTLICGWFVWNYGIVLRVKVRKEIKELTKTQEM